MSRGAAAAVAALALVACSDGMGPTASGRSELALSFRVSGAVGAVPSAAVLGGPARVAGPPMELTGSNGTLTLDEIRIIIDEVELKRADGACDGSMGSDDDSGGPSGDDSADDSADHSADDSADDSGHHSGGDCGEFETGPRFLDLPLDGEPVEAVTALIPAGTYGELDFEIEDLEDDADDATQAVLIEAVRAEVEAEFPDWPRRASALVVGSFTPSGGGDPVDFRVYIEAEIEIEMELIPNLVVDDAGVTSRELTVDIMPTAWFTNPDGTVLELPLFDYDATGELLEFELEMEHGFTEIEFDD